MRSSNMCPDGCIQVDTNQFSATFQMLLNLLPTRRLLGKQQHAQMSRGQSTVLALPRKTLRMKLEPTVVRLCIAMLLASKTPTQIIKLVMSLHLLHI